MEENSHIYVAGHNGLLGSEIMKVLKDNKYYNLCVFDRPELNLLHQQATFNFLGDLKTEYLFLCAAKVGGIKANNEKRTSFLYENLTIQNNVIMAAAESNVKKLLFFGSSCMYPRNAPQPLKTHYLNTGQLEPTNRPYALAKLAGVELIKAVRKDYGVSFISCIPCNLYGTNDNFSTGGHVIPEMIGKFLTAMKEGKKTVTLYGNGSALREFMHVSDLAEAALILMNEYDDDEPVNIGTGEEVSIRELAYLIKEIVGYRGSIAWDYSQPNGTPRKVVDSSVMRSFNWKPRISLEEGIKAVVNSLF